MKTRTVCSFLPLIFPLLLISGCAPSPTKSDIEEMIVKHFEAKNYKVIELIISNVNPIPLSEKRYMGTPGYTADVPTLVLEMNEDIGPPWNYSKGQKVYFKNAQISVRQSTGQDKKWLIANISGVSAP